MDYQPRAGTTVPATLFTVETRKSFYQIAGEYTIGGTSFGTALASFNGAHASTVLEQGDTIYIPDEWLGLAVSQSRTSNDAIVFIALSLILALALASGK